MAGVIDTNKVLCKNCIYRDGWICTKCGLSINYILLYGGKRALQSCEDYLSRDEYEKNRWISLTDKVILNEHQKRIIVHDFTALRHLDLEAVREQGYEIEFETDPYS